MEDEPIAREALAAFLEDAGFDVPATCSADEAVILLTEDEFAVLLTDIGMPGLIDGLGLAGHAREIHPGLPIIFVSGADQVESDARVIAQPTAWFAKPYDIDTLVATVGRMVRTPA